MAAASSVSQEVDLRELANRLLTFDVDDAENHVMITAQECLSVCQMAIEAMKSTEICINIKTPINIVGDLHGQFHDLLRIFDALGQPPETRFLFLGDYIDRGKYSLEVMMLLFVLMLLYPNSVYLLRGNHETANICCRYGFKDEISTRFVKAHSLRVLGGFIRAFQWLPLCAIVDANIFCCHGGISPSFLLPPFVPKAGQQANLRTLNDFKKPLEPTRPSVLCDIMWSDPMMPAMQAQFSTAKDTVSEARWVPNKRGCSFVFSSSALEEVMRLLQTHMVIRGHQLVQPGYQASLNKRCVTLFSAPGYCGLYNNAGSVLQIERTTSTNTHPGSFMVFKPLPRQPGTVANLFWPDAKDG